MVWDLTVEGLDNGIYITIDLDARISAENRMVVLATVENGEWVLVKMDWSENGIWRGSYNYGKDPTGEEIGIKIYCWERDLRVTVPSETKIEILLPAPA